MVVMAIPRHLQPGLVVLVKFPEVAVAVQLDIPLAVHQLVEMELMAKSLFHGDRHWKLQTHQSFQYLYV